MIPETEELAVIAIASRMAAFQDDPQIKNTLDRFADQAVEVFKNGTSAIDREQAHHRYRAVEDLKAHIRHATQMGEVATKQRETRRVRGGAK